MKTSKNLRRATSGSVGSQTTGAHALFEEI